MGRLFRSSADRRFSGRAMAIVAMLLVGSAHACQPAEPQQLRSTKRFNDLRDESTPDCGATRQGLEQFWVSLTKALLGSSNVVVSPAGISGALAMSYAGASGNTARELSSVLGGGRPVEPQFHTCMALQRLALDSGLHSAHRSAFELHMRSAIWLRRGLIAEPRFLDKLSAYYDSGAQMLDFERAAADAATAINRWASDQTSGQIHDLVSPASLAPETSALLVQAVYLRAEWARPFPASNTFTAEFQRFDGSSVGVATMHHTVSIRFVEAEAYKAAAFPYADRDWSMLIVLPDSGHRSELVNHLSSLWLRELVSRLQERPVAVALPKFKLRSSLESLRDVLQALGVRDAFSERSADFSALSRTHAIHLADLKQQALLAVDERGTEAAAVAAAHTAVASADPSEQMETFYADHPFLFFVVGPDNTIMFAGQVADPS
jgi:serpin B